MSNHTIGQWEPAAWPQPWSPRSVDQEKWSPRTTILFIVGANLLGWAVIVVSASMLLR
jgi:hypothetical protein